MLQFRNSYFMLQLFCANFTNTRAPTDTIEKSCQGKSKLTKMGHITNSTQRIWFDLKIIVPLGKGRYQIWNCSRYCKMHFYNTIDWKQKQLTDLGPLRVAVSLTACAVSDAKSRAPATGLVTVPTRPFPRPDMKPLTPPSVFTPSTVEVITLVNPPMIPSEDKDSKVGQKYCLSEWHSFVLADVVCLRFTVKLDKNVLCITCNTKTFRTN